MQTTLEANAPYSNPWSWLIAMLNSLTESTTTSGRKPSRSIATPRKYVQFHAKVAGAIGLRAARPVALAYRVKHTAFQEKALEVEVSARQSRVRRGKDSAIPSNALLTAKASGVHGVLVARSVIRALRLLCSSSPSIKLAQVKIAKVARSKSAVVLSAMGTEDTRERQ